MAAPDPPDPDDQLRLLCQTLNEAGVAYVVFGSHAARLHGAPLESDDVDLVPDAGGRNLALVCDALNGLRPRWRVPGFPEGIKIDGGRLEPRHFQADSVAVGLVTAIGNIDIVLQPRGFEAGYPALSAHAVTMTVGGVDVHVGGPRRPHRVEAAPTPPQGSRPASRSRGTQGPTAIGPPGVAGSRPRPRSRGRPTPARSRATWPRLVGGIHLRGIVPLRVFGTAATPTCATVVHAIPVGGILGELPYILVIGLRS